jgi:Domain of unknown function (DUF4351)
VPILNDIMEHKVFGPLIREGELTLLRRLLEQRFGELPDWAEARLAGRSSSELEELGLRLRDAPSLEELLK